MVDTELWKKLADVFGKAADHFNLTEEERTIAWVSAKVDPVRALTCYGAIARSLSTAPTKGKRK